MILGQATILQNEHETYILDFNLPEYHNEPIMYLAKLEFELEQDGKTISKMVQTYRPKAEEK